MEIRFFMKILLNMVILLNVPQNSFKYLRYIQEIQMQRSKCQNVVLGPGFQFMKCRILHIKINKTYPVTPYLSSRTFRTFVLLFYRFYYLWSCSWPDLCK